MAPLSQPGFQARDRVLQLERTVEQLKQLTGQQQRTITNLQKQNSDQADRILSLLSTPAGKVRLNIIVLCSRAIFY